MTLGRRPDQGGHQGPAGNPHPQSGCTAVDAEVITWVVGQDVDLGYQHFVTQRVDATAPPGGDKASKSGDSAYSVDDMCAVMAYSGIEDPQDCQVRWIIFAEKKKNVEACQRYLMKGMMDYAYSCRITRWGNIPRTGNNEVYSGLMLQPRQGHCVHSVCGERTLSSLLLLPAK